MKPQGLYISPTQFVPFAEPRQRLSDHIATRERSLDFFALGMFLPNPDPILKKQGRDVSVYTDLRHDAHVGGCIRRRKAAVVGLEWRVERAKASARATSLCQYVLEQLDMRRVLHEMLDATLYGWQPMEVLWSPSAARATVPLDVVAKPVHWFCFDADAQLRFKTREQPLYGELLGQRKFLLPAQEASYANPYGFADLSMCFWPTVFKRAGLKFWVTFTEKFGTPWVVGKTPRGTPGPEQSALLDQLEAMVQDAVAVVPDDASVEVVEAGGKTASADLYERLLMYCRSEIAIALLGQNQSTEASANKASATAGLEVAKDIRDGDARLCEASINQLLRWVVDINEGEGAPAPKFELFEQEDVDEVQAKRDKLLFDAGLRFTPAYWARVYGLEDGDIAPPEPPPAGPVLSGAAVAQQGAGAPKLAPALASAVDAPADKPASFAESTAAPDPLQAQTDALASASAPLFAGMVEQLQGLVDGAGSLPELQRNMLQAYGDLDSAELVRLMAAAFALAELKGMDSARSEIAPGTAFAQVQEGTVLEAVPDPRLDEISASLASVDKKLDLLSAKEPFVINNHIAPSAVQVPVTVTAQMPEQPAPVINMAAPSVTVQPAEVVINNTHPTSAVQTVQRDAQDEIVSTTTIYNT